MRGCCACLCCSVAWLLGVAPSHEIPKALPVTGCWLLESQVTPSLRSQQLPVTPVAPSHETKKALPVTGCWSHRVSSHIRSQVSAVAGYACCSKSRDPKGVAGYRLLVTSSLKSSQVSRGYLFQVRATHLSPMRNSVTSDL